MDPEFLFSWPNARYAPMDEPLFKQYLKQVMYTYSTRRIDVHTVDCMLGSCFCLRRTSNLLRDRNRLLLGRRPKKTSSRSRSQRQRSSRSALATRAARSMPAAAASTMESFFQQTRARHVYMDSTFYEHKTK